MGRKKIKKRTKIPKTVVLSVILMASVVLVLFFILFNNHAAENKIIKIQNPLYHYPYIQTSKYTPEKLKQLLKLPPPSNLDEFEEILENSAYVIGDEEHPVEFYITWDEIKLMAKESDEFRLLDEQLTAAKRATEKYQDIQVALGDGYFPITGETPWMGTHHLNKELVIDGVFDPERPEGLDYVLRDDEWKLAGLFYVTPLEKHPEGFATEKDVWHWHKNICIAPGLIWFSTEEEECKSKQWIWAGDTRWMLHVWVWEENPWGIFIEWNPALHPEISTDLVEH